VAAVDLLRNSDLINGRILPVSNMLFHRKARANPLAIAGSTRLPDTGEATKEGAPSGVTMVFRLAGAGSRAAPERR
jgi:hypothetical protein